LEVDSEISDSTVSNICCRPFTFLPQEDQCSFNNAWICFHGSTMQCLATCCCRGSVPGITFGHCNIYQSLWQFSVAWQCHVSHHSGQN